MKSLIESPVVLKAPDVELPNTKYQALAKKLHIRPPVHDPDLHLQALLSRLEIAVYDYTAVRRYLILKRPERHVFLWVPARRDQDQTAALTEKYKRWNSGGSELHGYVVATNSMVYNKAIPYPVLVTMDRILTEGTKIGIKPTFYISDFALRTQQPEPRRRYDPFLAVTVSTGDRLHVIERWDEPGFREEVYSQKKKQDVKK